MEQVDIMLENLSLTDINPYVCGYHDCDPGHRYGPFIRDYYLLHFVVDGTGVLESPGVASPSRPGRSSSSIRTR